MTYTAAGTPVGSEPEAKAFDAMQCMADLSRALVIAASPINRIVLSRIAERACLKTASMDPGEAAHKLATPQASSPQPGMIILDLDTAFQDHDEVLAQIETRRRISPAGLPFVVAVVATLQQVDLQSSAFDATVARPVTPETLQPVIERLLATAKAA